MKRPHSPFGLTLLIILGIAIAISGVVLHLALPAQYERVEIIPIGVGFGMALFGAYWMDPDRARKATTGVTHAAGELVHSYVELRTGDRKTDPVVRVEKTTSPDDPEASQEVKVSVIQSGGSPAPITATEGTVDPAPQRVEPLSNPVEWKDGKEEGTI